MSMSKILIGVVGFVSLILAGCCNQQPVSEISRICPSQADKHHAMAAARHVLGDMFFVIEKADEETGYLSTKPLPAAQFFEPWRSDTIGFCNWAEANLGSVERIAEITIDSGDGGVCINCEVRTRKFSMATRQISSPSEVYRLFAENQSLSPSLKLRPKDRQTAQWVDMGTDVKLQARILERIQKEIAKQKENSL